MSTQRQKQDAAMALYRELGWEGAQVADVMDLPLGTPEQRRVLKEGLEKGEWEGFLPHPTDPDELGDWGNFWGIDSSMLSLLALRVGVSPRRAASLLSEHSPGWDGGSRAPQIAAILAERGPDVAARFIDAAAALVESAWWELQAASQRSVHELGLPVPEAGRYLESYAEAVADVFKAEDGGWDPDPNDAPTLTATQLGERFAEHAAAGVPLASARSEAWVEALAGALKRGWLTREETLELVWVGMDAAQRPAARGPWVKALSGPLAVSDAELDAARDRLIPLLSLGHGPTVELLAPRLLANSNDEQAVELAYAALGAGTQKAKVTLLKALAARPAPQGEARAELLGVVGPFLEGTPTEAKAAAALLAAWGAEAPSAEETPSAEAARGLWTAMPALWRVPRFEVGEASADAVRVAEAAQIGESDGQDLEDERVLALLNTMAWQDPQAAEAFLRERPTLWSYGQIATHLWAGAPHADTIRAEWAGDKNGPPASQRDVDEAQGRSDGDPWVRLPERRRDSVNRWLGCTPVLLSTPSWEDLTVELDELLARLGECSGAGTPVLEDDLLLALTRLRGSAAGPVRLSAAQEGALERLEAAEIPVRRWTGKLLARHAGSLVRDYLAAPMRSPRPGGATVPPGRFTGRLDDSAGVEGFITKPRRGGSYEHEGPSVFPEWDDEALGFNAVQTPAVWRQVARRGRRLSPAMASNLVWALALRPSDASLAEAVVTAWERGLVDPGSLDPAYFGLEGDRGHLDGVAQAALTLAAAGGAAAAWGLLSRVLDSWAEAARPPRSLQGVIEALGELAPEALFAVGNGLAGIDVLRLPGLRALAARSGSSAVVGAARRVAGRIPVADDPLDPTARLGAEGPGSAGTPSTAGTEHLPAAAPSEEEFAAALREAGRGDSCRGRGQD
ncbi:MAG: hypothetical protein LBE25_06055 [Arthrobacter sp.]|nr:hypothetical protein [Arthrobacter sp.]